MIRCKDCKYWDKSGDKRLWSGSVDDTRACLFIRFPVKNQAIRLQSQIAFVEDTYEYWAVLSTKADFGCVEGQPKDDERQVEQIRREFVA